MAFVTDYPKDAVATLLSPAGKPAAQIALAAYDVVGFALGQYFGDVKYPVGLDFTSLSKIGEGADIVQKIQTKAVALKGSGAGIFFILVQLASEFGPQIWSFVSEIRALLNPNTVVPTPAPAGS